jgi:hypothetical protein
MAGCKHCPPHLTDLKHNVEGIFDMAKPKLRTTLVLTEETYNKLNDLVGERGHSAFFTRVINDTYEGKLNIERLGKALDQFHNDLEIFSYTIIKAYKAITAFMEKKESQNG